MHSQRIAFIRIASAALFVLIAMFVIVVMNGSVQAQTFKVLYRFTGEADGYRPYAGLTLDRAGNLYGTTSTDFPLPTGGTAFQLERRTNNWVLNTLSALPVGSYGRVVLGPNGALYGTTQAGGSGFDCEYGCGTVYNVQQAIGCISCSWTSTILYSFSGGTDGLAPGSVDPVFDQESNLYGTTSEGGSTGDGVVFKLAPSAGGWTESVIHNFTGFDGAGPLSGMIFDDAGNLYGTTYTAGPDDFGTVFRLARSGSGWVATTLYSFRRGTDGGNPMGGLILDRSGNLFGTTTEGGGSGGGGTVFELSPSGGSWTFTVLYSWSGQTGGSPQGNLAMDGAGNLYGAGSSGGAFGHGSVFKLTPTGGGWIYTDLHDFSGFLDGALPLGGMTLDANGNLYGTAAFGGIAGESCDRILYGCGVVWEITP